MKKRIIGSYEGTEKGPLLIVLGALHGNESAGVKAIDIVLKMLEVEPITNPHFKLSGKMVGLIGNRKAYNLNKRYIDQDLNRMWLPITFDRINRLPQIEWTSEEHELQDLLKTVRKIINDYKPEYCVLLDIHTTSSLGGIFVIPNDSESSIQLAITTNAPVIKGMLKGIQGTTLQYFTSENMGFNIDSIAFEAGHHEDKLSINRAIAAIVNCMRSINMVRADDVESVHDQILVKYSTGFPQVSELIYKHHINKGDNFTMTPGYKNFDPVKKGDLLGRDIYGDILSQFDALILMPLYQSLGDDGFFLIKDVS